MSGCVWGGGAEGAFCFCLLYGDPSFFLVVSNGLLSAGALGQGNQMMTSKSILVFFSVGDVTWISMWNIDVVLLLPEESALI